jgi:hypothetical protein
MRRERAPLLPTNHLFTPAARCLVFSVSEENIQPALFHLFINNNTLFFLQTVPELNCQKSDSAFLFGLGGLANLCQTHRKCSRRPTLVPRVQHWPVWPHNSCL